MELSPDERLVMDQYKEDNTTEGGGQHLEALQVGLREYPHLNVKNILDALVRKGLLSQEKTVDDGWYFLTAEGEDYLYADYPEEINPMPLKKLWDQIEEIGQSIGDQMDLIDLSPTKGAYERLQKLEQQREQIVEEIYANTYLDRRDDVKEKLAHLLYNMGVYYLNQFPSDLEKAENYLRRAIETYPEYSDIWFNLGECLFLSNKKSEAKECYEQALDKARNPKSFWNEQIIAEKAKKRLMQI